jgi:hypothetical protein
MIGCPQTNRVMPAKAGIHGHGPVFMDSGFRRNDNEEESTMSIMAIKS